MAEDLFNEPAFNHPRAPQNANGEVILGSLIRQLGLISLGEGKVGDHAREFRKQLLSGAYSSPSGLGTNDQQYLVESLLESPRLRNQKDKDVFYLNPIIPYCAAVSSVSGYRSNPWNPGAYILEMAYRGGEYSAVKEILTKLKSALSVESEDDVWSQFLRFELKGWLTWVEESEIPEPTSFQISFENSFPGKRFCEDILNLTKLKKSMSRRKWISLIESYLRLIISIDIMWYCNLHSQISKLIQLDKTIQPSEVDSNLTTFTFFELGQRRNDSIELLIKDYVQHSFFLKRLVDYLSSSSISVPNKLDPSELSNWINSMHENLGHKKIQNIWIEVINELGSKPDYTKLLTATKGVTKNLLEALTYIPGRRKTFDKEKSSYDQGYWYNKIGRNWLFQPGPAALTVMVQLCCDSYGSDFVSTQDLIEFFAQYGISTNERELSYGVTGQELRNLGYVIDSPDMEGGILINKPFHEST